MELRLSQPGNKVLSTDADMTYQQLEQELANRKLTPRHRRTGCGPHSPSESHAFVNGVNPGTRHVKL